MDSEAHEKVMTAVFHERLRQQNLHGRATPANPHMTTAERFEILSEEFGEVAQALQHQRHAKSEEAKRDAAHNLYEELVQVAAVAVAWLEGLEEEAE